MEEMNELFYRDTYATSFDAMVKQCFEDKGMYGVVLDDTAFYPEGGGQPADHGTLNGIAVVDVKRRNGEVVHYVKEEMKPGTQVHGEIDWSWRFDHMQNHTGEHIVSGLIHAAYGYDNIGFHMGKEFIQIDFNGPIDWEGLMEIEQQANEIVMKNVPVHVYFPSCEELEKTDYRSKKELTGKVRLVEVPGGDLCACCGTHVAYTGEIGLIKILSVAKYKDGVRVEMISGNRALQYMRNIYNGTRECMNMLSAEALKIPEAVEHLKADNAQFNEKCRNLQSEIMEYRLQNMEENCNVLIDFEEGLDRVSMIHMGNAMMERKHASVAAVLSKEKDGYAYFICSSSVNLSKEAKKLNAELNGRGGGRPDNIQGFFQSDEETIKSVLCSVFGNCMNE